MSTLSTLLRSTVRHSPVSWARACHIHLRPYQVEIARAVKDSIVHHRGLTFVVILPRQSGKNELQAHLFAWLLYRYANVGGRIVSVSPTFKPQTQINMDRVRSSLDACLASRGLWKPSKGYSYLLGKAQLQFFSGEPRANVLGATADLLLSIDEAQSIPVSKYDRDFEPMVASTNATRIFWGTAWTSDSLLERQRRLALFRQEKDGIRRLFYYTADDVTKYVPSYAAFLERIIAEHGRDHPIVRSQYFGETIDAQLGMFTPARLALLHADQVPASPSSEPARLAHSMYAFLIDVAGMDESRLSPQRSTDYALSNPGRDFTALSIVEVDLSSLGDLGFPTYHVRARHSWVGESHVTVFGKLKAFYDTWGPGHIVIDATGVGEGLWAMLDRAYSSRVQPVKFTQSGKSDIGWRFISIIESGRFRDHVHTEEVRLQYAHCLCEILPGPLKLLRWGVPENARGPQGERIHDDFLLADSLVARLDTLEWIVPMQTTIIQAIDPIEEMDREFRRNSRRSFRDGLFSSDTLW